MIVYDVATKVFHTRNICSAQHRWPDLWHYIYCFVPSGEAFTVKVNKRTHPPTHTHTLQHSRSLETYGIVRANGCTS